MYLFETRACYQERVRLVVTRYEVQTPDITLKKTHEEIMKAKARGYQTPGPSVTWSGNVFYNNVSTFSFESNTNSRVQLCHPLG